MTRAQVSLTAPPADVSSFPTLGARGLPGMLFRIFFLRDRTTGALNSAWRFGSVPPGEARFDLRTPDGTCYWSDRRYGSWVEVWRGTRVVDRADVTRRALFSATPPAKHSASKPVSRFARRARPSKISSVTPCKVAATSA